MRVTPLVFDLETAGHPEARTFIDPPPMPDDPTFDDITAPANYKDEAKIAAYIEEAKAKRLANHEASKRRWLEEYETACTDAAALDPNVGRIVALGWWTEEDNACVLPCGEEAEEKHVLTQFWREAKHRTLVGFGIKGFDCRFLVRRSQLLGVPHPVLDFGKYSERGIIDLYLRLTFGDGHHDRGVMKRSLKSFARRFGIPVNDEVSGADIPALVAAGKWTDVIAHCKSDVELTVALAQRLKVVREYIPIAS